MNISKTQAKAKKRRSDFSMGVIHALPDVVIETEHGPVSSLELGSVERIWNY